MGLFGKKKKKDCDCPHCRGGHVPEKNNYHYDDDFDFNDMPQIEISEDITAVDVEIIDQTELITQYLEAMLECETPDDVEDILYMFYGEVFAHAMQEVYVTEIKSKMMALNMLKNGVTEEDYE